MRGACKICADSQRAEIDAALLLGKPLRVVASEFSVSRSVLHRHLRKHCRGAAERALARVGASYARHLQAYMRQSQEITLSVMKAAQARGDAEAVLSAGREVRANVDLMRKLLARAAERKPEGKAGSEMPAEIQIVYGEHDRVAHTQ